MNETEAFQASQAYLWHLANAAASETHLDLDTLYSEACVGFLKAVRSFDPDKGAKLTSWIYLKVYRELQSLVRNTLKEPQSLGEAPSSYDDDRDDDRDELIRLLVSSRNFRQGRKRLREASQVLKWRPSRLAEAIESIEETL